MRAPSSLVMGPASLVLSASLSNMSWVFLKLCGLYPFKAPCTATAAARRAFALLSSPCPANRLTIHAYWQQSCIITIHRLLEQSCIIGYSPPNTGTVQADWFYFRVFMFIRFQIETECQRYQSRDRTTPHLLFLLVSILLDLDEQNSISFLISCITFLVLFLGCARYTGEDVSSLI